MFDSDKSAKIPTVEDVKLESIKVPVNTETSTATTATPESDILKATPEPDAHSEMTEPTSIKPEPTHDEIVQEKTEGIKTQIDAKTIRTGTTYKTGSILHTGSEVNTGQTVRTGVEARIGGGGMYQEDPFRNMPLSMEDKLIINDHPEFFANNPYSLKGEELIDVYKTNRDNLHFLDISKPEWEELGNIKVEKILEYAGENSNPKVRDLSRYLIMLQNFTEPKQIKPIRGLWGLAKSEKSEQYIARCLQNVKKIGRLEDFKHALRR